MKRKYWLSIVAALVFWTVAIGAFVIIYKPLGPRLPKAASTPAQESTSLQAITPESIIPSPSTPGIVEAVSGTPTSMGVCGNSGSMTFLILGESSPEDGPSHGADAIRLAKVDFDRKEIRILALPSELWVNTPALAAQKINGTKLTLLYSESKHHAPGSEREKMGVAVGQFAQTLQDNFGFFPEHYLVLKQNTFTDVVDALGGIEITLPAAVDGRSEKMGYFPAGKQRLNGDQVRNFVRILKPAGETTPNEWKRFERQNLVLQSIYQSILLPQNWDKIPALVDVFYKDILTDLSIKNILDLACLMKQSEVVIQQKAIGPEMLSQGIHHELLPRLEVVSPFIVEQVGK